MRADDIAVQGRSARGVRCRSASRRPVTGVSSEEEGRPVHRAALDHGADRSAALPVLSCPATPLRGDAGQAVERLFEPLAHDRLVEGRAEGVDQLRRRQVDGGEVDHRVAQPVGIGGDVALLGLPAIILRVEGRMRLRRQRTGEQRFRLDGPSGQARRSTRPPMVSAVVSTSLSFGLSTRVRN